MSNNLNTEQNTYLTDRKEDWIMLILPLIMLVISILIMADRIFYEMSWYYSLWERARFLGYIWLILFSIVLLPIFIIIKIYHGFEKLCVYVLDNSFDPEEEPREENN